MSKQKIIWQLSECNFFLSFPLWLKEASIWYAIRQNENIRHPLLLLLFPSQSRPIQNTIVILLVRTLRRFRERGCGGGGAGSSHLWYLCPKDEWVASATSCTITWRDGKVIDVNVCKIRQLSVLGPKSSAHVLRVPNAIFPTAIHQLVKGPCYSLLSKLLGRFSQKVNLLWSTLHLIESPAMSLSQHQEMWKC